MDVRHLLIRGLKEEPRLFMRNFFDQLLPSDTTRRIELLTRLHIMQLYMPSATEHYASLMLNYLLGFLQHLRTAEPQDIKSILASCLPLLASYVSEGGGVLCEGAPTAQPSRADLMHGARLWDPNVCLCMSPV